MQSIKPLKRICFLTALLCLMACGQTQRHLDMPDILLISIDTLRSDHMSAYGYSRETTPFIEQLSSDGARFTRVFTPEPVTDPSHASLFTSRHPLQHGLRINSMPLDLSANTLAEQFKSSGYYTMGAIAVEHMSRQYQFHQGFDAFADAWITDARGHNRHERDATEVNGDVFDMLDHYESKAMNTPFFLFVHYFDPHFPYTLRQDCDVADTGSIPNQLISRQIAQMIDSYDAEIRFVDNHISALFDRLNRMKLSKNMITCIVSDHGEQLGEHGYQGGHADIYRETVQIPMIFHGGPIQPQTVDLPSSIMDAGTTLLALAGLKYNTPVQGIDLSDILLKKTEDMTDVQRTHDTFLILGSPQYTRSMALIRPPHWYIRNMDYHFQMVILEKIDSAGSPSGISEQIPVPAARVTDGSGYYPFPPPDSAGTQIQPLIASVSVFLKSPDTRAEYSLNLYPRLTYWDDSVPFKGAAGMHVPLYSTDSAGVTIRPYDAVREVCVVYRTPEAFQAYRLSRGNKHAAFQTDLHTHLLTQRKNQAKNELYDYQSDEQMLKNLQEDNQLADLESDLNTILVQRYFELNGTDVPRDASTQFTGEEVDMLKSLGYITAD